MSRYILVCKNSGFIWGDSEDAYFDNPEAYAASLTESLGASEYDFHAYLAPASFPQIKDGQDQDTIDAVDRECEYIGFISNSCQIVGDCA